MKRLAAALVLALAACSGSPNATPTDRPQDKSVFPAVRYDTDGITRIELTDHGCYGECPSYTVTFRDGNHAEYLGGQYAPRKGLYVGAIDFDPIAEWLATQQPFQLADRYAGNWKDANSLTLTIAGGTQTKTVYVGNTRYIPAKLFGIIAVIEGRTAMVQWHRATPLDPFFGMYADTDPRSFVTYRFYLPTRSHVPLGSITITVPEQCAAAGVRQIDAQIRAANVQHGRLDLTVGEYLPKSRAFGVSRHWFVAGSGATRALTADGRTYPMREISYSDWEAASRPFYATQAVAHANAHC